VPLDNVAILELGSNALAVAVLQVLFASRLEHHKVGAGVTAHAVAHAFAQLLNVVPGERCVRAQEQARCKLRAIALENLLRKRESPCNVLWHAHFVDS
jgi:hypothetical protein